MFAQDKKQLLRLLDRSVRVYLIALASSGYFEAYRKYGRGEALKPFDAVLNWHTLATYYDNRLFDRADAIYEKEPVQLIEADARPHWEHIADKKTLLVQLEQEVEQRQRLIFNLRKILASEASKG